MNKIQPTKSPISTYLSTIGTAGGKAGTGPAKARTRKQAQAAAKARWDKVKKKAKK